MEGEGTLRVLAPPSQITVSRPAEVGAGLSDTFGWRAWATGCTAMLDGHRLAIVAVFAIAATQLLDVWTTLVGLSHNLNELNPLNLWILANYGAAGFVLAKLGFTVVISFNLVKLGGRWMLAGTLGSIAITGLAVVSNLRMLA